MVSKDEAVLCWQGLSSYWNLIRLQEVWSKSLCQSSHSLWYPQWKEAALLKYSQRFRSHPAVSSWTYVCTGADHCGWRRCKCIGAWQHSSRLQTSRTVTKVRGPWWNSQVGACWTWACLRYRRMNSFVRIWERWSTLHLWQTDDFSRLILRDFSGRLVVKSVEGKRALTVGLDLIGYPLF